MTPLITIDRRELRGLVEIELTADWEGTAPESWFDDGADIAWVRRQIAENNMWGWASVTVKIELRGMSATTYVGGCSYASEDDFKRNGSFDAMVDALVDHLAQGIEEVLNTHGVIAHDPIPCLWCVARSPGVRSKEGDQG